MEEYEIKLTFIEQLLGTVPKNKEIYSDFVASKAPKEQDTDDELDSIVESLEKATTGFHVDEDGKPIIFNYVIKGFFKDACYMLRKVPKTKSKELTAYKKIIDGLVFVVPRMIPIDMNGQELSMCERPLRVQTPKGERVALAKSESAPAGSSISFKIEVLGGVSKELLEEWLNYGIRRGLGQWRNASHGSFAWEYLKA